MEFPGMWIFPTSRGTTPSKSGRIANVFSPSIWIAETLHGAMMPAYATMLFICNSPPKPQKNCCQAHNHRKAESA